VKLLETKEDIFRSWDIWGSSLGYFFMIGIMNVLLAWIPTFLVTVMKFTVMNLGIVAAAPWTGAIVGNIVGGWFSDKIINKRRKPNMMFTAFTSIFMIYSLIYSPNDPYLLAALMFVLGVFMNIGFSTYMVYPMGLTTKKVVSHRLLGRQHVWLARRCRRSAVAGMLLDKYSWDAVWLFLAISCLLCLMVLVTIKEPVDDPLI